MINEDELKEVKNIINDFKPEVGFFENQILVPQVIGRLKYIKEICNEFQGICADKSVATHIDGPLRNIVDENLYKLGVPEPKVGEQYLASVNKIIEEDYIKPIDDLLKKYPSQAILESVETLTNFFNDTLAVLQSIPSTKDKLFRFSLKSFLNVKKTATNEIILGEPVEVNMILMPFQTRVDEMANVAQTTIDSIKLWSEGISVQKKKHLETLIHLSQIKAAKENVSSSKFNLYFQVAVIIFTIVMVIGSQRATSYLEKIDLQNEISIKSSDLNATIEKNEKLQKDNENLKSTVEDLKKQVEVLSKGNKSK